MTALHATRYGDAYLAVLNPTPPVPAPVETAAVVSPPTPAPVTTAPETTPAPVLAPAIHPILGPVAATSACPSPSLRVPAKPSVPTLKLLPLVVPSPVVPARPHVLEPRADTGWNGFSLSVPWFTPPTPAPVIPTVALSPTMTVTSAEAPDPPVVWWRSFRPLSVRSSLPRFS